MSSHYSDMGLYDYDEQVTDCVDQHRSEGKIIRTPHGIYRVLSLGKNVEIWGIGDDESDEIYDFEIHYNDSVTTPFYFTRWVKEDFTQMFGMCYGWSRDKQHETPTEVPYNLMVVNAGEFDLKKGDICRVQIAGYGENMLDYIPEGQGHESSIPCGTFPLPGKEKEFDPSPYAILSAKIKAMEKRTNEVTGKSYYYFLASCFGLDLVLLVDEEHVPPETKVGGYIHDVFWLSAKVIEVIGNEKEGIH